ncbi:SDR family oxidoreductase [Dyadobacter sp. CY356]|uniref:SDR family oxidoreductase n=1 Tax=Dyadobacter sp. CY356 TaxID=2906442 RepID=UPI001F1BD121|nr:SDR family oxidoreductase [Dyadobacter sp. CY356]MCF0054533.1 SDR family oxidoreductase [Dyadobacter sp. CY356]
MKKLEDKIAVITGGNSGIGLAVAKLFAQEGAKVVITGRNPVSIRSAVIEIGHGSAGLVSDAGNVDCLTQTFEDITKKFDGKIDVLVVNAGVYITAPLASYTEEMFDQTSDVNFKGAFFSVQRALPYLKDGASIILTGSTVAETAKINGAAFAATKAALRSLARSFSAELLPRNIRVNVVSPGPTDTSVFGRTGASELQIENAKKALIDHTPLKRLASAGEIAETYLYLASDDSGYMLGAELVIDGGYRSL